MLCQCTTHVQTGGCHSFAERKTAYMYRFPIHIDRMCSLKLFLNVSISTTSGWGCSLVAGASDWHADDAGWIPRCGKGFFSQSRLSVQTLLHVSVHPPCAIACFKICAHIKDTIVHVRVWWITQTLKHPACTEGWATLLCHRWLSPGKATRMSHWDSTVVKSMWKKKFKKNIRVRSQN